MAKVITPGTRTSPWPARPARDASPAPTTVDSNGRFSSLYKGFVSALRQDLPQPPALLPGRPEKSGSAPGLRRWLRPFPRQDWVVYLKHPFGGNIWAATPIAWPFQPIGSSHSPMAKLLFDGGIPLTKMNRSCCTHLQYRGTKASPSLR
jgi:hypothetical protein